jgi:dienelactone hydrolase
METESEQDGNLNGSTPPQVAVRKPALLGRLWSRLELARKGLARAWQEVALFCLLSWRGAAIGSVAVVVVFMAYMGFHLRTGLGVVLDTLIGALIGALGVALLGLLIVLMVVILKAWPKFFSAALLGSIGSFIAIFGVFGAPLGFPLRMGSVLVSILAVFGASIAVLTRRRGRTAKPAHKIVATIFLFLSISVATVLAIWLGRPGKDPNLEQYTSAMFRILPPSNASDPSKPGNYKVLTLFYGSGSDRHRPEYGRLTTIKTNPVDASPFVKNLKGFKATIRKWYWGFGPEQFPINARVWFPDGKGPFPLLLVVHGNHQMEEYSDPGYAYLGELLASRGYILASVDENFLNVSWTGDIGGENGARGWILLKHLEAWRGWNEAKGNPFYRKVDLSNIALIGHSRGGEAIAHAAAFNKLTRFPDDATIQFSFNFAIKTLIAIAPIDGQYEPANQPVPVENVNYLVLQGSHDSDLFFFAGNRPYRRVKFTDGHYWTKAALYTYRANHGQFNTVWGSYDSGPPLDMFINRQPLLKGEEQRQIAKTYISAFLEATLGGRKEYIPMFRDYRVAAPWLPKTIYLNQFQDSNYRLVSDFAEGIDVTKTTVPGGIQTGENLTIWREQELKGRGDWGFRKKVVYLGWEGKDTKDPADPEKTASYSLRLPEEKVEGWQLDEKASLVFTIADSDEDPHKPDKKVEKDKEKRDERKKGKKERVDFTLELVDSNNASAHIPLSQVFPLQPILKVKFTKWDYLETEFYQSATEPEFQTYGIPLSDFVKANAALDPRKLRMVRFRFDRTKSDVIILDEVGFQK